VLGLEERVKASVLKHPDWDSRRIAKSLAVRKAVVETILSGGQATQTQDSFLVSMEKIREKYDLYEAIVKGIADIPKGRLIPEMEFARRIAGSDKARFNRAVGMNKDKFFAFRIKLQIEKGSSEGQWYWGSMEDIAEANRLKEL
jgi:hypothetical protein